MQIGCRHPRSRDEGGRLRPLNVALLRRATTGLLFQFRERLADGVEIRKILRSGRLLAVLDDTVFIDDEGGASADRAETD